MLWVLGLMLWTLRLSAAAPLVFDFENENAAGQWTATGANASVKVTGAKELVLSGRGSLACSYAGQPGAPFSLSITELDIAGAASFSVSLRALTLSPLVLGLAEEDGSLYHTFVTCPPGELCHVRMPLTDFQLQERSTDENATLDADQIRTFSIQELANLGGEWNAIFGTKTGDQLLIVDDLKFSPENVPSRTRAEKEKTIIDSFEHPWLALLPLGGAQVARIAGGAAETPAWLRVRFLFQPTGPEAWPGVVLPIGHTELSDAKTLRVRVRSPGALRLHLLLEEQDGSRYEARTAITEAAEWQARDVPVSEFALEAGSTDENPALDLDQLRVLIIVADAWNALLDETERGEFDLAEVLMLK